MKQKLALALAIAAWALNPLATLAADDKYPAANFEPTVIYLDKSVAQESAQEAADPKYPAANFEPKVVYIDEKLAEQTEALSQNDEVDPKYPAAYFKPKVIYP